MFLKLSLIMVLFVTIAESETLRSVSDDDLLQLIKDREKLIVLFSEYR